MNAKFNISGTAKSSLVAILAILTLGNGGCSKRSSNIAEVIKEGRIAEVKTFLEKGGDPNIVTDTGQSLLLIAAVEKHPEIVKLLLARGANPDSADRHGQTPVFFAAYNQDLDSVAALIKAEANVNAVTKAGEFALLRAVVWGNTRLVEMLVKAGADVNLKPADPRVPAPLQIAIQGQMQEIEAILRQAGATE